MTTATPESSASSASPARTAPLHWAIVAARGTRIAAAGLLLSIAAAILAAWFHRPSMWPVFAASSLCTALCVGSTLWTIRSARNDFRRLLRFAMIGNGLRILALAALVLAFISLDVRGTLDLEPLWLVGSVLFNYAVCSILDVRLLRECLAAMPSAPAQPASPNPAPLS